jgi:N-acetylglucosamine malate deacetylase 2
MPPDPPSTGGATALLVVVAHPDDEVIGAGGRLLRAQGRGVRVVHLTDGAPRELADARASGFQTREAYARARAHEARAALALAGVAGTQIAWLGAVDQEASLEMASLARTLAELLARWQPAELLAHPYEGGHPDHDAAAFVAHAACALAAAAGGRPPALAELASYHDDGAGGLVVGRFLSGAGEGGSAALEVALADEEQERKRAMIACHATQGETLRPFLTAAALAQERFRPAPRYRFTAPPHPGTLRYERFAWGVRTGAEWRRLAAEALRQLGLEDPL